MKNSITQNEAGSARISGIFNSQLFGQIKLFFGVLGLFLNISFCTAGIFHHYQLIIW